jgi:hypothetical protein
MVGKKTEAKTDAKKTPLADAVKPAESTQTKDATSTKDAAPATKIAPAEPTATQPATPEAPKTVPQPLTIENWTPDIVASGLATFIGMLLAPILAIALSFLSSPTLVAAVAVVVLIIGFSFSAVCSHMQLHGYRRFQPQLVLLTHTTVGYFTVSLVLVAVMQKMQSTLATAAGYGELVGAEVPQLSFLPSVTAQSVMLNTAIIGVALLVPGIVRSRHELRVWWFLPLALPVIACFVVLWLLGATALI